MGDEILTVRFPEVRIGGVYETPAFWNATQPDGRIEYKMSEGGEWRWAEREDWRWSFPEIDEAMTQFA